MTDDRDRASQSTESVERVSPLSQSTDSYVRTDVRTDEEGCQLPRETSTYVPREKPNLSDDQIERNERGVALLRALKRRAVPYKAPGGEAS